MELAGDPQGSKGHPLDRGPSVVSSRPVLVDLSGPTLFILDREERAWFVGEILDHHPGTVWRCVQSQG